MYLTLVELTPVLRHVYQRVSSAARPLAGESDVHGDESIEGGRPSDVRRHIRQRFRRISIYPRLPGFPVGESPERERNGVHVLADRSPHQIHQVAGRYPHVGGEFQRSTHVVALAVAPDAIGIPLGGEIGGEIPCLYRPPRVRGGLPLWRPHGISCKCQQREKYQRAGNAVRVPSAPGLLPDHPALPNALQTERHHTLGSPVRNC